jgi:hypothetical protein
MAYLLPNGTTVERSYQLAGNSRQTINVAFEASQLAATSLSTVVRSTNGVPIIAERSMWWPGARAGSGLLPIFWGNATGSEPHYGAVFESLSVNGQPPAQIVVERAMYSGAMGIVWAAGPTCWRRGCADGRASARVSGGRRGRAALGRLHPLQDHGELLHAALDLGRRDGAEAEHEAVRRDVYRRTAGAWTLIASAPGAPRAGADSDRRGPLRRGWASARRAAVPARRGRAHRRVRRPPRQQRSGVGATAGLR